MRKVLSVFIAVCLVLSLFTGVFVSMPSARADTEGVWIYTVAGGKATITGYTGPGGVVEIPSTIGVGAYPVTRIGASALDSTEGHLLTSVTIANSVASIGNYAFHGCSALTGVAIGSGVASVGTAAFYGCTALTSVAIPDNVTDIGNNTFQGCTSLTSVTIGSGLTSIGYAVFSACTKLTNAVIPNGVTSIGNYAFYQCTALSSVTIPNSVSTLGQAAFYGCSALATVAMGSGVTSIGSYVFQNCAVLASVAIPSGVTSIGTSAFQGCSALTSVTIPNSVTSIGSHAFRECAALTSVTIPSGVTSIDKYTFHGCAALTSVTIPSGVTAIGAEAFFGCSALTSVTIPNGVTSIGDSAFSVCTGLTGVTIGSGMTTIGDYAFGWCTELLAAYFLGSPPTMGTGVFESCAAGFTVRHVSGATGWTDPWYGYPTATFIPPTYTLTANVTGPGTVAKAPDASSYALGTDVTLTASANSGYTFTSWSGDLTGTMNPVTITMDTNKAVTATFSPAFVLSASWNLVSVPVPLPVASIPGLQSVFWYHDNWSVPTTLTPGEAYWVQVETAVTVPLPGSPSTLPVPISFKAGWQLLGNPYDVPLPISSITNHSLITTCYSYGPNWGVLNPATDSLQPGKGYWINLSAATTLTLTRP